MTLKKFFYVFLFCTLISTLFHLGCSATNSNNSSNDNSTDITNTIFTLRSADCQDYIDSYSSDATDILQDMDFSGSLSISVSSGKCNFTSNSIPNHDFNDGDSTFVTNVSSVSQTYSVTTTPSIARSTTELSLDYDNAIFINGVKLDLLAAACYGVGSEPLGEEKIGCNDNDSPWRYDPMYSGNNFGTDSHNAHTQPNGQYHYHGSPNALFESSDPTTESPVIGFAADGFPIYGPYIDDDGTIRAVVSGYTLKTGNRVSQTGEGAFPGGTYDGTFRDDFEFTDAGDLDECNGRTDDEGNYGYYITSSYPWVMACFKGTPDTSFAK